MLCSPVQNQGVGATCSYCLKPKYGTISYYNNFVTPSCRGLRLPLSILELGEKFQLTKASSELGWLHQHTADLSL